MAKTSPAGKSAPKVAPKTARKPVAKATAKPAAIKEAITRGPRSKCPINLMLEAVGDSWSLLIIRDLMFKGRSTYKAFLGAEEKIATNILADRLVKLEAAGLISKSTDPEDARKFIYKLTEKGADLAPLLVEMMLWSNKYHITDTPKDFLASLQKNKTAFATRVVKDINSAVAPKTPVVPVKIEPKDETLSLFDGF
ncbi:helix-turn-helix domain-containing protein [Asticcacaulis sp. BYS171W]|uniref:Helix-turn-helix domain-containing protein n=1 Tax=Asticcacaulis aquaticus TaxID=2984212 RepID=A0ABT5HP26_9CAUL|nr:helix-turn-helix domain-containing protein [Asticcacaulis aquaticus]MDC7681814.1 helix-turn-helix domain-containing protein [Asticcacaulis aquaticus]